MVDIEKIDEEAHEEYEYGKVYQDGQCFDHPGNLVFLDAMRKICTLPRPLMGTLARLLSDPEVSTCPLLQ
jgi:hypothetical protein